MLKREPTEAGAITELFDRLHALHLDAGEPGVRQIATGIGRGVLSYTTVHNVFRGPRVPKWGHLELIVDQLGGNVETFHALWRAARLTELAVPGRLEVVPPQGEAPPSAPPPVVVAHERVDFVMVTNKLLLRRGADHGLRWDAPAVGAGPTLSRLTADRKGAWVGWSAVLDPAAGPVDSAGMTLVPVPMSAREVEWHLEGHCNSTLWPLYHDSIERPEFHRDWREANRVVNRRFAETVAGIAAPGAVVWVHDYQLQLVPAMLRELRPDLRTGFFLHIPLPAPELFTRLPGRAETLRGLLGADLVGFQHPGSARNFLRLCADLLGLDADRGSVAVDGRRVLVDVFPISVDVKAIERLVAQPRVRQRAQHIRAELGNPEVLIAGMDRLDYTKGIEQRLLAYGELLEDLHPSPNPLAFMQVATSTRERVARYAKLRERVDRLAGHLNGSYGRMGKPVVHYTNQVLDFEEIVALYLAADVMVVTPLRDGMNLVCKEYVASRTDNRGVLVLSEFAGAAAELPDAILVNPNDLDDLKGAILRAVAMDPAEQARRIAAMRAHLREHDADAWIASFIDRLDRVRTAG